MQKLGEELLDLPISIVRDMGLNAALTDAIIESKTITAHEGRRRHLQYIGTLMRESDPAPVRRVLARFRDGKRAAADALEQIRLWRDALAGGDDTPVEIIIGKSPKIDRQQFLQLIRSTRKEAGEARPPRFSRELFRFIRDATKTEGQQTIDEPDPEDL